jgi:hypothetical protein
MKTQITKRKILIRPSGAPAAAPDGAPDAEAAQAEAAQEPLQGEPPPPAPDTLLPPPQMVEPKRANYTWAVIVALLAVGCFIGLLAVQWVEWNALKLIFPLPLVR